MKPLAEPIPPPQQVPPCSRGLDAGFAQLLRGVGEEVGPGGDLGRVLGEVAPDEGEEGAGVGDEGRGWWDMGSGDLGLAVKEAGWGVRFRKGREEVVVRGWKRSGEGGE